MDDDQKYGRDRQTSKKNKTISWAVTLFVVWPFRMSNNVQVAVRVRPFNEREKNMKAECCIRMLRETQQTIITDPETKSDRSFTFDFR